MTSYTLEIAEIYRYIDNFDPHEFSTDENFNALDENLRMICAQRCRARIQRKRKLQQKIVAGDFFDNCKTSDVIITQEQIDALLGQ